jgi:transcriptional regulator GlxA family with amidase domain
MDRRDLLKRSAALGFMTAVPVSFATKSGISSQAGASRSSSEPASSVAGPNPLMLPANGKIPVAFPISADARVIDYAGPWAVFEWDDHFQLYTVAEALQPVVTSDGLTIVPNYTFGTAPKPRIIVIPGQKGDTEAMVQWIRKSAENADLTMSVCVGASVLARTGLLDGKAATNHHYSYKSFASRFPKVQLQRGVRWVEEGNLATAAGETAGIDLALHVVERYFGRGVAQHVAESMEYLSQSWMDVNSSALYAETSQAEP